METSTFSIFDKLLEKRVVTVGHPIDDQLSHLVVAQLLYLESEDAGRPIQLYVRSPGGSLPCAMAIRDCMRSIKPDVATVAVGTVEETAVLLVASGSPGTRLARADSSLILSDPPEEREAKRYRQSLSTLSGRSLKKITEMCRQQTCLSAEEALRMGLLDHVLGS